MYVVVNPIVHITSVMVGRVMLYVQSRITTQVDNHTHEREVHDLLKNCASLSCEEVFNQDWLLQLYN